MTIIVSSQEITFLRIVFPLGGFSITLLYQKTASMAICLVWQGGLFGYYSKGLLVVDSLPAFGGTLEPVLCKNKNRRANHTVLSFLKVLLWIGKGCSVPTAFFEGCVLVRSHPDRHSINVIIKHFLNKTYYSVGQ